ncbi:MAG: hypothetical protein K8R91_02640 [Phycisphaerae bacterium]|nr:hypothetical protein [Phycisphaerae bacterium]
MMTLLCGQVACDKPASWHDASSPLRLAIEIDSGECARHDRPVEIELNFSTLATQAPGGQVKFDETAMAVVEVKPDGSKVGEAVAWQFDRSDTFNATSHAAGTLTLVPGGETAGGTTRRFQVYFGGQTRPSLSKPMVTVTDDVQHQDQASYKIVTPGGTYLYHKEGGGFASLFDANGNDWISYRPGGGSAGHYRGIPNLVYPEGYFHPGGTGCVSRLDATGPIRVGVISRSRDDKWACRWDIFPTFARLTVTKAPGPYWFLYEGTPGGKLDPDSDFCIRPPDVRTNASESWIATLGDPEWVAFGDEKLKRVLYLVHCRPDEAVDSYRPMKGNMTVFGFGRKKLEKHMTAVPNQFVIGLAQEPSFVEAMNSAYRNIEARVLGVEVRKTP